MNVFWEGYADWDFCGLDFDGLDVRVERKVGVMD